MQAIAVSAYKTAFGPSCSLLTPPPPLQKHYNSVIAHNPGSNRVLKFGLRHSATKQPLHWNAPADVARGGIQKVFERAQLLQDSCGDAAAVP